MQENEGHIIEAEIDIVGVVEEGTNLADGGVMKFNHLGVEDRTRPKFPDYLTEVKYDAKSMSKRNKTYVFHDIWNKGVSENYSWGTDEDLEYMKEKGVDFKVIATYDNLEEIMDTYAKGGEIKVEEGDMIKSSTIKGKVYQSMGTMFKIEDEYSTSNIK